MITWTYLSGTVWWIMSTSRWRARLLESTRGQVLSLLRIKDRTVNDIADELQITDNAVRAHLVSLERDGLVRQTGKKPGVRRPHVSYGLSPDAEQMFAAAYGAFLNNFVAVVRKRLSARGLRAAMRQVGRRIARVRLPGVRGTTRAQRIKAVLGLLKEIGGAATIRYNNDKLFIHGNGCPLAAITADYPEACSILEALLAEGIGARVKECCIHGPNPSCRFQIDRN
jgi:predicted ArsR family transcriptional regulator